MSVGCDDALDAVLHAVGRDGAMAVFGSAARFQGIEHEGFEQVGAARRIEALPPLPQGREMAAVFTWLYFVDWRPRGARNPEGLHW